MLIWKPLARFGFVFAILTSFLAVPIAASTKKGEKFLKEGRKAESKQDWTEALRLYRLALEEDPADAAYQLSARRVQFAAGQFFVDMGQRLRSQGNLEQALEEFLKAIGIDPGSTVAEQELRRTREMMENEKKQKPATGQGAQAKPEERGLTLCRRPEGDAERRVAALLSVPELKPISPQVNNLKIANQPVKVLYETIGKLTGINVLFDADYQDQGNRRYNLDLSNTTLEEALDYTALLTKTFWKPLSANAIFVTNDNATKRRDYEEHVTKIFYLQNVSTTQETE